MVENYTKITYIYGLYENDVIKYVGKSNNPKSRLNQHIYESKVKEGKKHSWIRHMVQIYNKKL